MVYDKRAGIRDTDTLARCPHKSKVEGSGTRLDKLMRSRAHGPAVFNRLVCARVLHHRALPHDPRVW